MEVMLALFMITIVFSSLMTLQSTVVRRCIMSTFKIERFYALKNSFLMHKITPLAEGATKTERLLKNPEMKMVYEKKPIKKDSQLARFEGLYQEVVMGSWQELGRERIFDLCTYKFQPVEKKDEAA